MHGGIFCAALAMVSLAFAGCLGEPGEPETETTTTPFGTATGTRTTTADTNTTTSPTTSPATTATTGTAAPVPANVSITSRPTSVMPNGTVNLSWAVDAEGNETVRVEHTAVHWADFSVPNPTRPEDYGNTSGERRDVPPGAYSTNFIAPQNGTAYVRAHAVLEGQDSWSAEVTINVTANGTGPRVWTVRIGTTTIGPASNYDPPELTIAAGDRVEWSNQDPAGIPHTATEDNATGTPAFDTGDIEAGNTSAPVEFPTAGTFDYSCTRHPATMPSARIMVAP